MDDPLYLKPDIVQFYINKFKNLNHMDELNLSKESLEWFRKHVSKQMNVKPSRMFESQYKRKSKTAKTSVIGRMYFFHYAAQDPGDKKTGLYDEFPLIFIFNSIRTEDGHQRLYGLNMHYFPPAVRKQFFLQLLKLRTDETLTPKSRLRLTWLKIKAVCNSRFYKRAVHAYRSDRILSTSLLEIPPEDWQVVVFLQLQHWKMAPNAGKDKKTGSQSHYRKLMRGKFK